MSDCWAPPGSSQAWQHTRIPSWSRLAVKARLRGLCVRCNMAGSEFHHRRPRSVVDSHRHGPCNGVYLCGPCHRWAHAHPAEATEQGFIVSRCVDDPTMVPIQRYDGWWYLHHDGRAWPLDKDEVTVDPWPEIEPEALFRVTEYALDHPRTLDFV